MLPGWPTILVKILCFVDFVLLLMSAIVKPRRYLSCWMLAMFDSRFYAEKCCLFGQKELDGVEDCPTNPYLCHDYRVICVQMRVIRAAANRRPVSSPWFKCLSSSTRKRCHFVLPARLLYQCASLRLSHSVTLLWRTWWKWLFNHAERSTNQRAQAEWFKGPFTAQLERRSAPVWAWLLFGVKVPSPPLTTGLLP